MSTRHMDAQLATPFSISSLPGCKSLFLSGLTILLTVADQSGCVQIVLDSHFFIKELRLTSTDLLCIPANDAE
jgi:hypothetical protein